MDNFQKIMPLELTMHSHPYLSSLFVGIWESGCPFFLICYLTKVIRLLDFQLSRGFVCLFVCLVYLGCCQCFNFICIYLYVVYRHDCILVCMPTCVHVGQRCQVPAFSLSILFPSDKVSLNLELGSQSPSPSKPCFLPFSTGFIHRSNHSWLFMWTRGAGGVELRPSSYLHSKYP